MLRRYTTDAAVDHPQQAEAIYTYSREVATLWYHIGADSPRHVCFSEQQALGKKAARSSRSSFPRGWRLHRQVG